MQKTTLYTLLSLVDRTLAYMDNRLEEHSQKVCYVFQKLMQEAGTFSLDEIMKYSIVAYIHDIGIYKAEQRRFLSEFEITDPHAHSVYGYLFLKHFSSITEHSDIVKYHHVRWENKDKVVGDVPNAAFLLHLADRICVTSSNKEICIKNIKKHSGTSFSPEHIELFLSAERKYNIISALQTSAYEPELKAYLSSFEIDKTLSIEAARMLSYSIDFRSRQTFFHSITVESIASTLCDIFKIDEEEKYKITIAATIHDIGKVAIPIEILEKTGKLSEYEFDIMKTHAIIGYNILSGLGIDDIRDIAAFHHEKPDGSGYPFGLKGDELSFSQRIVSVADVVSALVGRRSYKEPFDKETVIKILSSAANQNKLDELIVNTLIENYDCIYDEMNKKLSSVNSTYSSFMDNYYREYNSLATL